MKYKKTAAVILAAAMTVQAASAALAAEGLSGSDAQGIGPGFSVETENGNPGAGTENGGEQPVYPMAWEKVNGVYMDDTGAPIEGAVLRGISVSKWQGDVDWGKVAADDVSFALIRMGSFGYEGEYTMERLREEGLSLRDAVKRAARELGLSRNELYDRAVGK